MGMGTSLSKLFGEKPKLYPKTFSWKLHVALPCTMKLWHQQPRAFCSKTGVWRRVTLVGGSNWPIHHLVGLIPYYAKSYKLPRGSLGRTPFPEVALARNGILLQSPGTMWPKDMAAMDYNIQQPQKLSQSYSPASWSNTPKPNHSIKIQYIRTLSTPVPGEV